MILFYALCLYLAGSKPVQSCLPCVLGPWAALLVLYAVCCLHRPKEQVCSDALKIGMHATAVAVLGQHNLQLAHACSLCALLDCALDLATDVYAASLFALALSVLAPVYAASCHHAVAPDAQLQAVAWAQAVRWAHWALWKLI